MFGSIVIWMYFNPIPFSAEEQRLAKDYADVLGAALIFLMPERTPNEVALLLIKLIERAYIDVIITTQRRRRLGQVQTR